MKEKKLTLEASVIIDWFHYTIFTRISFYFYCLFSKF